MPGNAGRGVASGFRGFDQPVVFLVDAPPAVGWVAGRAGVGEDRGGEGEGGLGGDAEGAVVGESVAAEEDVGCFVAHFFLSLGRRPLGFGVGWVGMPAAGLRRRGLGRRWLGWLVVVVGLVPVVVCMRGWMEGVRRGRGDGWGHRGRLFYTLELEGAAWAGGAVSG